MSLYFLTDRVIDQDIENYRGDNVGFALILNTAHVCGFWFVVVDERHAMGSASSVQGLKFSVGRLFQPKAKGAVLLNSSIHEAVVVEFLNWKGGYGRMHPILRIQHDGGQET